MIASHYVLEELIHVIDDGDTKHLGGALEKFSGRYYKDKELAKVYRDYKSSPKQLEKLRKKLTEMHVARKIESSGGYGIPFSDVRRAKKQELEVPKNV